VRTGLGGVFNRSLSNFSNFSNFDNERTAVESGIVAWSR
jgi:hypothetical protein